MAKGKNGKRKRHTPFTAERREKYLEALRQGHTYIGACGHAGVARSTADAHREKDPEFAMAVDEAFGLGVKVWEDMAVERAKESDAVLIFGLKNKGWSDRQQIEHSGDAANPINVVVADPKLIPADWGKKDPK